MREPSRALRAAVAAAVVLYALPLVALVVRAFADEWRAPNLVPQQFGLRGVDALFSTTTRAGEALVQSLSVALLTTAIAVPIAWTAARAIGERRLRRPIPVFVLIALPILVPGYATGIGLSEWFVRLDLADTRTGLVLAHLTVVLPYVVLVLAAGFGPKVSELEEMGRSAGLAPWQRLGWVTLPAVRAQLAVACVIGFLVSWGQYGLSLAVGAGEPTLPGVLLPFLRRDQQIAAAVCLVYLAPAAVALLLAARASRSPL